jgi:hypothetical protein
MRYTAERPLHARALMWLHDRFLMSFGLSQVIVRLHGEPSPRGTRTCLVQPHGHLRADAYLADEPAV